ncbi:hypothetical protein D9M70_579110 [compost metagenome]
MSGRLIHLVGYVVPDVFSEECICRKACIGSEVFSVSVIVAPVGIIDGQQRSVFADIAVGLIREVLGQPSHDFSY